MIGVKASEIESIWHEVAPLIESALEHSNGKLTLSSIKRALKKKDMQLWVDGENIGITRIDDYPAKRVCTVMVGAGNDLTIFEKGIKVIEAWARAKGCDSIEVWGRKGWIRVLGYTHIHEAIGKDL